MRLSILTTANSIAITATAASAFVTPPPQQQQQQHHHRTSSRVAASNLLLFAEKSIGIFFGTSTGSTEEAANLIAKEFGSEVASGPFEIDAVQGSVAAEFSKYDSLIVGTPTWNTGADMERSGTGWDEIYYSEMQELNIAGKKVAVFGLGDSVSYSENYADATGELHDVFEALGCKMVGYTSTEGYLHDESKSIRGDQFCGLLLDAVNQEELTEGRVQKWVADLIAGGILESGGSASSSSSVAAPVAVPLIEVEEVASPVVEVVPSAVSENCVGFAAHYNPRSDKTMWISNDGRSSYVTAGAP